MASQIPRQTLQPRPLHPQNGAQSLSSPPNPRAFGAPVRERRPGKAVFEPLPPAAPPEIRGRRWVRTWFLVFVCCGLEATFRCGSREIEAEASGSERGSVGPRMEMMGRVGRGNASKLHAEVCGIIMVAHHMHDRDYMTRRRGKSAVPLQVRCTKTRLLVVVLTQRVVLTGCSTGRCCADKRGYLAPLSA